MEVKFYCVLNCLFGFRVNQKNNTIEESYDLSCFAKASWFMCVTYYCFLPVPFRLLMKQLLSWIPLERSHIRIALWSCNFSVITSLFGPLTCRLRSWSVFSYIFVLLCFLSRALIIVFILCWFYIVSGFDVGWWGGWDQRGSSSSTQAWRWTAVSALDYRLELNFSSMCF